MRKVLVLLLMVAVSTMAVSLKGVELGSKLTAQQIANARWEKDGRHGFRETLGGIEGLLITYVVGDGRIYSIGFSVSSRIYSIDVERLKNGLEKKFGIVFVERPKKYSDDYYLRATKDGVSYSMSVEYNRYYDAPYEVVFFMDDKALIDINDQEEQAKANEDF